jgi:hypothetical protein
MTEAVPFTILAGQNLNVFTPQFNPSLGTLESATTIVGGTTSTALEFFSTGAGGPYDILVTDTLSVGGVPGLFGQELTGTVPANQPVFTLPVTFLFGPLERGDPPELGLVGSGSWNEIFSLPSPSLTIKQSPAPVIIPGLSVSGASVTTYTYTPAMIAVPEPRSFGVLAVLFGFGVVVRNGGLRRAQRAGPAPAQRPHGWGLLLSHSLPPPGRRATFA